MAHLGANVIYDKFERATLYFVKEQLSHLVFDIAGLHQPFFALRKCHLAII